MALRYLQSKFRNWMTLSKVLRVLQLGIKQSVSQHYIKWHDGIKAACKQLMTYCRLSHVKETCKCKWKKPPLLRCFSSFCRECIKKFFSQKNGGRDSRPRSKSHIWIITLTFVAQTTGRKEMVTAGILTWAGAQRCILIRDDELSHWWANKRLICAWHKMSRVA